MGTTSPRLTVTVTNQTAASITITTVAVSSAQFQQTNNCATLVAGATCTVTLAFKPAIAAGALLASIPVAATLTLTSAAGNVTVALSGRPRSRSSPTTTVRSCGARPIPRQGVLVERGHARRDAGPERERDLVRNGAGVLLRAEYAAFNRDNTGYVTDLYKTFFNRAPDSGGLAYWVGQLASGLPREVASRFMFSPEFKTFTQAIFGNTPRARGDRRADRLLPRAARAPAGQRGLHLLAPEIPYRPVQRESGPAILAQVEAISSAFALSAEYVARARTTTQYVGDLYNAFLRRGGDIAGVQYWIGQISTGVQTREQVRVQFKNGVSSRRE
jgi:hypothetical protein